MKKKILIIVGIIILLFIIAGTTFIFLNYQTENIALINDSIVIEYGNTYNPTIEKLIDLIKYKNISLDDIKLENNLINEENKDYPSVGKYEVKVFYKDKCLIQSIEVKDTTKPEISIMDNIQIEINTDLSNFNFKELINVFDLSDIKDFSIDYSNVNSSISGEYIAKVIVEDIYLNKTEKEFKVTIKEDSKQEEVIENKENVQNKANENIVNTSNSNNKASATNNDSSTKKEKVDNNNSTSNNKDTATNEVTKKEENNSSQKEETKDNNEERLKCDHENNKNWFNTEKEAIAIYEAEVKKYGNLWENNEIDDETYYKKCPEGYETWSCPFCGKWSINMYY